MSDLSTDPDSGYRRGGGQRRPASKGGGGMAKSIGMNLIMAMLLAGLVVGLLAQGLQGWTDEQPRRVTGRGNGQATGSGV